MPAKKRPLVEREINQRSQVIYPSAKRMSLRTRLGAMNWRAVDWIARRRKKPPLVTSNYKKFFIEFINRARAAKKARKGKPVVVMLGGIAGGGKTTLARRLKMVAENLYPNKKPTVKTISLDSYFKPRHKYKVKRGDREIEVSRIGVREVSPGVFRGGRVIDGEFDNPRASDLKRAINEINALRQGRTIKTMQRDVSTGKMTEMEIDGSKIDFLIIEGLYTLHAPLAKLGDINIGVQASLGQQFLVRSTRDIQQRKRKPTPTARKFAERAPYQKAFVVPTLKNADIIMDVEKSGVKPGGREFMVWLGEPKRELEWEVFIDEIGLDHKRNKWRKLARKRKNRPEIVRGENDDKRLWQVSSFIFSKNPDAARILSNTLLVDPSWEIRARCAEVLGIKWLRKELKKSPEIKKSLTEGLLKDSDWRVRAQCAESLAYIFNRKAAPTLAKALNRKGMHQLGVAEALRYLGYFDLAKKPKELKPYLKGKVPTMERLVEEAWGYFNTHPEIEMPARYRRIFEDWGFIDYW